MELQFTDQHTHGIGTLIINHVSLPHEKHDPLGRLWAKLKKRLRANFGIDVTGLFTYKDGNRLISCSFCLNYGAPNVTGKEIVEYDKYFTNNFKNIIEIFKEVIKLFVKSDSLAIYKMLSITGANEKDLNKVIDDFIKDHEKEIEKAERDNEPDYKFTKIE